MLEYLEDLCHYKRALGISERTINNLILGIRSFIKWLPDDVTGPETLTSHHLVRYQLHLANRTTPKGFPLMASTINSAVWAVRSFLRYLHREDLVAHIKTIKLPRNLPTSVLTHDEMTRLLTYVVPNTDKGMRDRTILELLYSTGIRVGELSRLSVRDVNLNRQELRVHGKGDKERLVPVGATALRYLETYLKAVRPLWRGSRQSEALFLNNSGTPMRIYSVQRLLKKIREQVFPDIQVTPHTFRRSCTTEMVRANANLYHVKELLGHESLETLKAYTKLNIADLKKTHAKCHPRG